MEENTVELDIQSLRAAALNSPLKQEDIATPFWRGTDGQFALADIPNDELMQLRKNIDTTSVTGVFAATLICRALVKRTTGERVFTDADRDMVAHMGTSVLTPIFLQISRFYGLGTDIKDAIEDAKKNS